MTIDGEVETFNVAEFNVRLAELLLLEPDDIFVHSVEDGIVLNVCRSQGFMYGMSTSRAGRRRVRCAQVRGLVSIISRAFLRTY